MVKNGYLPLIKILLRNDSSNLDMIFITAAYYGKLKIVEYIWKKYRNVKHMNGVIHEALNLATSEDHLNVLKYLFDNMVDINKNYEYVGRIAAEHGYIDIFEYFLDKGLDIDNYLFLNHAAEFNHLLLLKWFEKQAINIFRINVLIASIIRINSEMLIFNYLYYNGKWTNDDRFDMIKFVIEYDKLEILTILIKDGYDIRQYNYILIIFALQHLQYSDSKIPQFFINKLKDDELRYVLTQVIKQKISI
jgi:hypothetical protein